jgi:hypothetical protein
MRINNRKKVKKELFKKRIKEYLKMLKTGAGKLG